PALCAGKLPLDVGALGVDLLAFTAHKLGGPKGIGALACSERALAALQPLQFGGGQERGLRSGTSATHQVLGFGLAATLAVEAMQAESDRVSGLRERLWSRLQSVGGVWRNSPAEGCLPGTLNLGFEGVEGESLMLAIRSGVWASSGSACASASAEPSYVLRAMGLSDLACQASLRLSLGRWTEADEVDRAAVLIAGAVERLRERAPPGVRSRIR
ncbi:MAG: cysteine desulfurase family protein, partial [Steroidobacteraceae bacterium]